MYRDGGLYKVRSGLQRSKLRSHRSKEERGGRFRETRTKEVKKVLTKIHRHVWKTRRTFSPAQTHKRAFPPDKKAKATSILKSILYEAILSTDPFKPLPRTRCQNQTNFDWWMNSVWTVQYKGNKHPQLMPVTHIHTHIAFSYSAVYKMPHQSFQIKLWESYKMFFFFHFLKKKKIKNKTESFLAV